MNIGTNFLVRLDNVLIKVNRIFYIYNISKNSKIGAHIYKNTKQVLICVSGSIKISCFNGVSKFIPWTMMHGNVNIVGKYME